MCVYFIKSGNLLKKSKRRFALRVAQTLENEPSKMIVPQTGVLFPCLQIQQLNM